MNSVAFIFPGQGSQHVGMGKGLYESYSEARNVFNSANEILKIDLKRICFEGPREELVLTSISQPAILVASVAALRAFMSKISNAKASEGDICAPYGIESIAKFSLGLSLGEYTALIAAGVMTFEDGLKLVRKRGIFMEEACRKEEGKMASIIGMEVGQVEELCRGIGCEIANLNCPGQVVVSGRAANVELLASLAKDKGAKRVFMLDVDGAFHSNLMIPAKEKLKLEIEKVKFLSPKINFISNVNAEINNDPESIRENLIRQLDSRTFWEASIRRVARGGVRDFLEIGPGSVLKGLLRKIDKSFNVVNIEKGEDIENYFAAKTA